MRQRIRCKVQQSKDHGVKRQSVNHGGVAIMLRVLFYTGALHRVDRIGKKGGLLREKVEQLIQLFLKSTAAGQITQEHRNRLLDGKNRLILSYWYSLLHWECNDLKCKSGKK